jgi:toxin-antitoxin system PIN domain toxin
MHPAARNWFQYQAALGTVWATCALTEAGFVRVLSNPAVNQGTLTPLRVTEVLEENLRRPGHRFWAMDLNWPEAARLSGIGVESYQQVTDIYLIGLAVKNKGRLVTFDKALGKLSKHVLLLG